MKVYIDVSNLMTVNFVTGIQRVVREIVTRLLRKEDLEVTLLSYNGHLREFYVLDNAKFNNYFKFQEGDKTAVYTEQKMNICDMDPDAVFFEIDSVWSSPYRRSALLPELKKRGLKIVAYVYDTIPIIHPQFCHTNTLYKFMDYFGAVVQYADEIIVSTQSVLDSIYEITDRLGLKRIPGYVSWLGSDFTGDTKKENIAEEVESFIKKGEKYVLIVGTIEPRKNHKTLLQAFENGLFEKDICLVFVGRIGWNVETLEKQIRNHKYKDSKFFFFEGLNDVNVDYLYRNAYFVAFPTYDEGFGLPMIEAFERGIPVIASNCKVLREVGGENAVYFSPDSPDEFVKQINNFLERPEQYQMLKEQVARYVPFTWDQTLERVYHAICELDCDNIKAAKVPAQLVVLSARCQDISNTLPYIEAYMPFIKKLLLCCPEGMKKEFTLIYKGRLEVEILTDDNLLEGRSLPDDHQARNFFLRSLVMRRDELDDVFIMSDDDYRPLQDISEEVFLKDGCYQAYYCHSLDTWKGTAGKMTSYDLGMFRTKDFLLEHQYPVLQYSSHMPQIIDKEKYQEFLDTHNGVELLGIDEWSGYFNWLQHKYPKIVEIRPYVTMCWPGNPTDWAVEVEPKKYLFENYYEELYEEGRVFYGFSKCFSGSIATENLKKKKICFERKTCFKKYELVFKKYKEIYTKQFREVPSFVFMVGSDVQIHLPEYVVLPVNGMVRIPAILCEMENTLVDYLKISYYYHRSGMKLYEYVDAINMLPETAEIEVPVFAHTNCRGKQQMVWIIEYRGKTYQKSIQAYIVDTEGYLKAAEV